MQAVSLQFQCVITGPPHADDTPALNRSPQCGDAVTRRCPWPDPVERHLAGRHAGAGLEERAALAGGPNVSDEFQSEGGEDPVRRRELLARAAGLAGAAAFGLPVTSRAQALTDPGVHLDDLLYGSAGAEPVP